MTASGGPSQRKAPVTPKLIGAIAAAAILTGISAAAFVTTAVLKRETNVYKCSADKDIEYIAKSGSEYLIINPSKDWSINSFLVSSESPQIPKNWHFYGMKTEAATNSGFKLKAPEAKPYIRSVVFDATKQEVAVSYGPTQLKLWKAICRLGTDLDKVRLAANNAPIEYLLLRNKVVPFLNPALGQKDFNLSLYNSLRTKKHSTYSVYKLLSGIQSTLLTGDQNLEMQSARRQLIDQNSSQTNIWEFDGSFRYWWEYPNEKAEAELHARKWCQDMQYSSLSDYTTQGYKIVSSKSEVTPSGWTQHNYTDGRFGGYVRYAVNCNGTRYELKKEGTVDGDSGNNYG